ncbi:hypothetical protein TWF281_002931 [Arthrobotrys megalospora]
MEGTAVVVHGAGGLTFESRLLNIPTEVLDDILEHVPKEDLFTLSTTCSTLRNLLTPKLFPRTLKIYIWTAIHDWRNGIHHFSYPAKQCEQGYLDDRKTERIIGAPAGCLRHVTEFRVIDDAHSHDRFCAKIKHKGLKRPDEVLLTIILRKLGAEAKGLNTIVIPRNIPIRMFATILESAPNLRTLEAGIESRAFYRESRNKKPYESLLAACTSLKLEQLKFNFSDTVLIQGILRTIERCSNTVQNLSIKGGFWQEISFDGLENFNLDEPKLRPKMRFSSLERLQIQMAGKFGGDFASWLLHLAEDFKKLSFLALWGGQDTQGLMEYILDNGARIQSLQLLTVGAEVDKVAEELRMSRVIEKMDHIHTLQLSEFHDWDMGTIYSHRHTLKRLWINCHELHSLAAGETCPVGDELFRHQIDKYPFTKDKWPNLEELAVPYLGIDELPLHEGIRVLRIEHLYDINDNHKDYESILRPYVSRLVKYAAPSKPNLEVIVIMPESFGRDNKLDPCYLCIDYEADGIHIETRMYMSYLLQKSSWSYLFQEQARGRMWDDRGIWADKKPYH